MLLTQSVYENQNILYTRQTLTRKCKRENCVILMATEILSYLNNIRNTVEKNKSILAFILRVEAKNHHQLQ